MKRLCLLAGYNKHGIIQDYVVYYAEQMSKIADVYYLGDFNKIDQKELDRLKPHVKYADAYRHSKYDFGCWQELIINVIGWNKVKEYDELIFCNDSCYGPIFPIEDIFEKFENDEEADVFGLIKNSFKKQIYLENFFIVFKKNVITSDVFKDFLLSIKKEEYFTNFVRDYEINLSKTLIENNFKLKVLINNDRLDVNYNWKSLIKLGFPFFKIKNFTKFAKKYKIESMFHWDKFLSKNTNYDVNIIRRHLISTKCSDCNNLGYLLKSITIYKIKRLIKKLFAIHITRKVRIIKIFGFHIVNRYFSYENGDRIKYPCIYYDKNNIIDKL